jgi:hypothetical protein
VSGGQLDH